MSSALPIDAIKSDFLQAIAQHHTVLLSAEPGAGKSTRLPLWLLETGANISGKIYLLQPRRVAVKSIALFLAKQLDEPIGQTIGYRLRDETKVSKHTRLEVVTEGILVQIMQNDPEMSDTSVVILDEFHERSLQADLVFALARDIQQGLHEDLTLVLMSATLAQQALIAALPDAVQLCSEGRSFPVDILYQPPSNIHQWRSHCIVVIKQTLLKHQGSILVFLPGSGDIRAVAQALQESDNEKLLICPLYGDLNLKQQQLAIAPCGDEQRKVVLATNIAETSLTIEGITIVIDSGLEKVALYDESQLTNKLIQRAIAKSSAIQRAGRAGRLTHGLAIRLYGEEEFQRRNLHNALPITRADILPIVIEAARWGVSRLAELPLIDVPVQSSESVAWQTLIALDVVDNRHRLTPHGEQVANLPCHARFAHMIVKAKLLERQQQVDGLAVVACLVAALLEARDILSNESGVRPADINIRLSLLKTKLRLKNCDYRYQVIINQAQRLAKLANIPFTDRFSLEYTGVLLFLAYPERLAKRRAADGEYLASYGKGLYLDVDDGLVAQQYLVAANVSPYQHKLAIRLAAALDIELLLDWQLVERSERNVCAYLADKSRIVAVSQTCIGGIVLSETPATSRISEQMVYQLWREKIIEQGLNFLHWREQDLQLLARWRWLTHSAVATDFPDVSEQALLESLDLWLQPFIGEILTKSQLDKLELSVALLSLLDYSQQQLLNKLAPSHFIGPTGRKCPIRYSLDAAPIVSLPMQEVYGMQASPSVGRQESPVNLTLELLSPAQRPIQITSDLAGFWQGSYKEVQKEMKAKYPKHYWPDEPAKAKATNKTKRHIKN